MKKIVSDFRIFTGSLSDTDKDELSRFFQRLDEHLTLPEAESRLIRQDFGRAILYYVENGVPLTEALRRIDVSKLGGYYARPPILWYPLDDAAKIYPLSMKRNQMNMFRLSSYLTQDVVPELLQLALTFTIKRFPTFATTIKTGFFWHYIDATKRRFNIEQEKGVPLAPINVSADGAQSFRVKYYNNRISVEFFHILTDGTGGIIFLKTLIAEYLRLTGVDIPTGEGVLDIAASPSPEETENDFPKAETDDISKGLMDKAAVQMSGRLSAVKPCRVLHFEMDSEQLRQVAKSKNTTVTAYILSVMFVAGRYSTDQTKGRVQIQVPINMRQYYESKTLRNFSMYCNIKMPLQEISGVEDILPEVGRQLKEKASKSNMSRMINASVRLVRALRFVPLFVKRPFAVLVYGFLGDKVFSNTISNLGVIKLPPEMSPYVEKLDFLLGASVSNRAACAMLTYNNVATLGITKMTADPSFENKLYELFLSDGITPVVRGSELYGS